MDDLDEFLGKFNYHAYDYNEKYKFNVKKLRTPIDVLFKQKE